GYPCSLMKERAAGIRYHKAHNRRLRAAHQQQAIARTVMLVCVLILMMLGIPLLWMLVAAGEGAILAGQAEPHRECSMAVSGDSVAWWTRIPPFGRGFSRHSGLPIRWVFLESAEARASALRSSSR